MGLEEFGKRLDKEARAKVAFHPQSEELTPGEIPLGIPAIDLMLGGGIPRGKSSIFVGADSSGKTLLAQLVIAAAQRQGGSAIFFDVEHTYDPKWFALTGVQTDDPDKLLVVRPKNLEHAFDSATKALLYDDPPDVLVIDSIAALSPRDILNADMEKQDFRGLVPRKIGVGMDKLTQANRKTAIILINQIRVDMSVTWGNPETEPGGKKLRHLIAMRIRVRRSKWLTENSANVGEENFTATLEDGKDSARIGFMLKLRVEKSKVAAPWGEAEIKHYFDGTIDPLGSLIHLAIKKGLITGAGSYYTVLDSEDKIHGMTNLEKLIREDDELKAQLTERIKE